MCVVSQFDNDLKIHPPPLSKVRQWNDPTSVALSHFLHRTEWLGILSILGLCGHKLFISSGLNVSMG